MEQVQVTLPDSAVLEVARGTEIFDVARLIGKRLAKSAVAAELDGRLVDLACRIDAPCRLAIVTADSPTGLEVVRHSASHVMADAVLRLFPGTQITIGPSIENGFYYDFAPPRPFVEEDLAKIEAEMAAIIAADRPFVRQLVSRPEAESLFAGQGQTYKLEIVAELPEGEPISLYRHGDFVDLCRGPHLRSTGQIGAFRLLSIAGAYWRGDERNAMLQRIYGTAFDTRERLDAHLAFLEEAKRRDHRRLGKELGLFTVSDEIGPGLILWQPKGAVIRSAIEEFWKKAHYRNGYELVYSPHLARLDLWRQSGHTDFYRENMYSPMVVDEQPYQIKPMNCPFHIQIYKSRTRSYRDLPIRWAELGTVYRYERSGVLHGLMRVRGFTQDDAHLFCTPEQLPDEIVGVLRFTMFILGAFGFSEFDVYLSTRPEKFVGSEEHWERATAALRSALEREGVDYRIDPGEGVFYGPKIDIKIKDKLGRSWQCTTIQVDFNLPERFGMTFVGEDGREHAPIMIHRALMGSLERFFGILIEHFGGRFPVWLAPVQAAVLTVTDRADGFAREVERRLRERDIRVVYDSRNEKLGFKVREAQLDQVPYMLIVGDREAEARQVTVRRLDGTNLQAMGVDEAIGLIESDAAARR